jgi:hypothetical protein
MPQEFKIDFRHQLKSFRECFVTLAWIVIAMIIGVLVFNGLDLKTIALMCILFWLIASVGMTIPFHINYLVANWDTKMKVDNEGNEIQITQARLKLTYKLSDIRVTRHLCGHHKPGRAKSWTPIPFDNYGYLEIKTNDLRDIYVTSLMIDPFNPPIKIDKTEYRLPIIWSKCKR